LAAVVEAKFGSGTRKRLLESYQVSLRDEEDLVPIGWVGRGLKKAERKALSDRLMKLAYKQGSEGVKVRPEVSLALTVSGVRWSQSGYRLLRPRIVWANLDAALDDVDEIDRLEKI
jgi:ATP-dependent DNA ligase